MKVSKKIQKSITKNSTSKVSKVSKVSKTSKVSTKQQDEIIKIALKLKAIYQALDDCLLKKIDPKLKPEIVAIMTECNNKFKSIKPFIKQRQKVHMCNLDNYLNKKISNPVSDIIYGKCNEIAKERSQLDQELSEAITPDFKKFKKLSDEFKKMLDKTYECFDTKCHHLKTQKTKIYNECLYYNLEHKVHNICPKDSKYLKIKREYDNCTKDKCSSSTDKEKGKKILKEITDIEKKTKKLLDNLVIPDN